MQRLLLLLLFTVFISRAFADDTDYQRAIVSAFQRFGALGYRNPKPGLTPAEEQERLRLLGQLITDAPVWALAEEVKADFIALTGDSPLKPADQATAESLKEFILSIDKLQWRATTHTEAQAFAQILRRFVVRRDVAGAKTWANAQ